MSKQKKMFFKMIVAIIVMVIITTNIAPTFAYSSASKMIYSGLEKIIEREMTLAETEEQAEGTEDSEEELEGESETEDEGLEEELKESEAESESSEEEIEESEAESESSEEELEESEAESESSEEETEESEAESESSEEETEESQPESNAPEAETKAILPEGFTGDDNIHYPIGEDNVAIAFTATGLATALGNGGIDTIHLGSDIELVNSIRVMNNNQRTSELVIDGTNPYAEDYDEDSVIHTLTERKLNPASNNSNMHIGSNGNLKYITLQNIEIIGYNFFGTFHFNNDDYSKDVTLCFDNVQYTGPQPIHAIRGTVIIKDSDITLITYGGLQGEVAEANEIILAGNIRVTRDFKADHRLFLIHSYNGYGDITIASGAEVVIEDFAVDSVGLYENAKHFRIESDAYFSYTGYRRISVNDSTEEFFIGAGAEVDINIKGNLVNHAITTRYFTIEPNAKVTLTAWTNQNNYAFIRTLASQNSLQINNPEYLLVFNNAGGNTQRTAIYLENATSAKIHTEEIRHWNTTRSNTEGIFAGSATDQSSDYRWYQADGTSFQVTGLTLDGYEGADNTSLMSEFKFQGVRGIVYGRLNGIVYTADRDTQGELPVDFGSPYRTQTTVEVLASDNLSKPYSEFLYWLGNDGEIYYPGDKISLNEDLELLAIFESVGLVVHFDTMTTEVDNPSPKIVVAGETYGELPEIARLGYVFSGWYNMKETDETEEIQGKQITTNSIVEIAENHTLYARWQEQLTIRFHHVNSKGELIYLSDDELFVNQGTSIMVTPKEIAGYKSLYYSIGREATSYQFDEALVPEDSLSVYIHYASTMIDVDFPTKFEFSAYLSNYGKVTSQQYQVKNHSELPVNVWFKMLIPVIDAMDGVELVASATSENQLHLNLLPSRNILNNGFRTGITNINPNQEYNILLGTLAGQFSNQNENEGIGAFEIGGFYSGTFYKTPKRPLVRFTFHYKLAD